MSFIGNSDAKKLALNYSQEIKRGNNLNIIIIGESGCGKTTLAIVIAELAGVSWTRILGSDPVNTKTNILIIDEAHTLQTPETLFEIMDLHKQSIIILTTELGVLAEPLVNRCMTIYIKSYTFVELLSIAHSFNTYRLPKTIEEEVVRRSKGFPRGIEILFNSLNIFKRNGANVYSIGSVKKLLDTIGVDEKGLTEEDRRYLNIVKENQPVSLTTISKIMGVPKETLERYIEPYLIREHYIKITSKGRVCG